jgi:protein-S-isoprenylcysteine O-methyltransferase Ste14
LAEVPQLGARGGGWVVLQFVLIAAVVMVGLLGQGWPDAARWWLKGVGVVLLLAGLLVVRSAVRALGIALTPYPRPRDAAALVETGPYAIVRHPIYAGAALVFAGISLALSPAALAVTVLLVVLWALKSRVEERFLRERYPPYAEYCSRTRYRLVPFVY